MRESFIEENCIFFLNEEENSHHQHTLFLDYSKILENRLELFLKEYSISAEKLGEAIEFARTHKDYKEMVTIFDEEDNFQKFKKYLFLFF